MESAPSLDLVHNAILTLYQGKDVAAKESANIWLGEFQKSIHAWQICDNLLQEKRDLESCYFGAQTMRTKIQYSFHELPAESYFSLRDSLIDHLFHCDTNTNQAIVIQLCLALADLALQVPQWKDVVLNIIERFGQDPKHVFILMELLTVVPEEVNRRTLRLGANRREELSQEFSKQANAVLVVLAKIGEDAFRNGSDVLVKVFKCLGSWITLGVLPSDQISQHPLLQGTFQVLANVNTPAALHEAATDCIVEALILCESSTTHATLAQTLIQSIFNLEPTYHACVANEDIDKLTNFCRLFTELAETVLMNMVDTPGDGLGNLTTLDLLLSAISYHDYSLAEMTFNFWYRLSEVVYQTDSGVLADVFKPYIERLLFALCKHCRFDADHEGVPSQNEEFCDFRKRVVECVRDVVFIMSSSDCFRKMFSVLQSQPAGTSWEEIEAPLFVMSAIAKNIVPDEEEIVTQVLNAVLQIPATMHVCVRYTCVVLLGELKEWIEAHPEVIEATFRFLLEALRQPTLCTVAAEAIDSVAAQCKQKLIPLLPQLLAAVTASGDEWKLSNSATIGLLRATATIMSDLPREELTVKLRELCLLQAKPLAEILEHVPASVLPSCHGQLDPIVWLDRLAAIFRHISPTIDNGNQHPCLPVVQEIWPLLSQTFEKYQAHLRTVEHTCRCVRFAIRCLGTQSHPLLQPLVTQMVSIYAKHPHSCFLYLGSILVDEYGAYEACSPGLLQMTTEFVGPTLKLLDEPNGLRNHPDTVDDLFRLGLRLIQRCPGAFFPSELYRPFMLCAIQSLAIEHREANQSVVKFISEVLEFIKNGKKSHPDHPVVVASERTFAELGPSFIQTLIFASIFSLPSSLLRDMAELLFLVCQIDTQVASSWLQSALQALTQKTVSATAHATPEQLQAFHDGVLQAKELKNVANDLRDFVRLFR